MLLYDGLHYDALAVSAFQGAPNDLDVTVLTVRLWLARRSHAVLCAACACVYTHTNIRRGFSQLLACCVLLLLLCCSAAAAMQLCHMLGVHSLAPQLQCCGWAKEEARRQTALQLVNAIGNVTVALHSITPYASLHRFAFYPSYLPNKREV